MYKVKVQAETPKGVVYYRTDATTKNGVTFLRGLSGEYQQIEDTQRIVEITRHGGKGAVSVPPTHNLDEAIRRLKQVESIS